MTTTDTAAESLELAHLAPTDIAPHPKNVRTQLGDLGELADSIRAQGILQPLVVVPPRTGKRHILIAGHRRLAAARRAGLATVPCVVRHDLPDEADQLEAMLVENGQRSDLTVLEEADAYQALLDLGVDVKRVARKTGRTQRLVRERVRLAAAPTAVRDHLSAGDITLDQAAAVQSFADDPAVFDRLCSELGTANLRWSIENAVRNRERRAVYDKALAELTAAGTTVMTQNDFYDVVDAGSGKALATLRRDWANAGFDAPDDITDDGHTACPGHVAVLHAGGQVMLGCTSATTSHPTPEPPARAEGGRRSAAELQQEKWEAENAARAELRNALDVAATVRTRHLAETVQAGGDDLAATLLRAVLDRQLDERLGEGSAARTAALLGLPEDTDTTDVLVALDPLRLDQLAALFALVSQDAHLADLDLADGHGWHGAEQWWLDLLGGPLGYEWSDVELAQLEARQAEADGDAA